MYCSTCCFLTCIQVFQDCLLLFPSSVLDTFQSVTGGSFSSVISFYLFILSVGFSWREYRSELPFPFPMDPVFSELFTMTCPFLVALHGMAHSFAELHKPICHNKAVIHEGHWELNWRTYSSFCCATFSHFSGNFIIPSSESYFFFLSKGAFYSLQGIEIFSIKIIEIAVSGKYREWIRTSQPSCNSFCLVVK